MAYAWQRGSSGKVTGRMKQNERNIQTYPNQTPLTHVEICYVEMPMQLDTVCVELFLAV
jgi:hypothetical protein